MEKPSVSGDKVAKIAFHPSIPAAKAAVCIFSLQSHEMINLKLPLRFHLNSAKLLRGKRDCGIADRKLISKPMLMTNSELF